MVILRKYIVLLLLLILLAFGASTTMKVAIGIGAFDAVNQSIAHITGFQVGDILTIMQMLFVVAQFLILKKDSNWRMFLQIPLGIIIGQFINFFFYEFYGQIHFENYFIRLAIFIGASIFIGIVLSGIMALDLITMPVENLAMVISLKTNRTFGQVRQYVDVISILLSFMLAIIFSTPFTIREGTIIGAVLIGPLLNFFMPKMRSLFVKWHLVDRKVAVA